jgi:hypothetical protein
MSPTIRAAAAAVLLAATAGAARAEPPPPESAARAEVEAPPEAAPSKPPPARPTDTAALEARLAFLEERICAQRAHAEIWWTGWLGFYSFGAFAQAIRTTLVEDNAVEADLWVSVGKSVIGVVRYAADPYVGIEPFEPEPTRDPAKLRAQVAEGERVLVNNAEATVPFGPWYGHLANLALNAGGAVIVGVGYDDWTQGLVSAAIGFGVGEISLLTGPWEADSDLEEYEALYGPTPRRESRGPSLTVQPMGTGMSLNGSF